MDNDGGLTVTRTDGGLRTSVRRLDRLGCADVGIGTPGPLAPD